MRFVETENSLSCILMGWGGGGEEICYMWKDWKKWNSIQCWGGQWEQETAKKLDFLEKKGKHTYPTQILLCTIHTKSTKMLFIKQNVKKVEILLKVEDSHAYIPHVTVYHWHVVDVWWWFHTHALWVSCQTEMADAPTVGPWWH